MTPDLFADALTHHRAGRLHEAAQIYQAILAATPNHADSLNLLGVIFHQLGNHQQAIELIQRAIQINPGWNSYYVNLASALRALGRHDEAIRYCRAVLSVDPELREARLALGLSLQALKQWQEAEREFQWLTDSHIGDSRGPQALGNLYREQGKPQEAIPHYLRALDRNPRDAAAHLGLGTVLLESRNPVAAELHLRRAVELSPKTAAAWMNYGTCLMKLGREREAVTAFQQALEREPDDPRLGINLGQAWLGSGDPRAAENCFKTVLKFHPNYPAAIEGLADVQRSLDHDEEAVPLYEQALQFDPAGHAYKGLANALWEQGDVDRAVAVLRDGIAQHPNDVENHVRLGVFLASGGDLDGAASLCREALQKRPGDALALVTLAQTLRAKLSEDDRQLLENALLQPIPDFLRAGVHFGIAQVADATSDFAKAAEHLRLANALSKSHHVARNQGYDPKLYSQYIDQLMTTFGSAFFAKVKGFGLESERPVFIVGMPRSGTTLVEQILASHPKVFGAGERRYAYQSLMRLGEGSGQPDDPLRCLDGLTNESVKQCASWHLERLERLDGGKAARIADKMPDNFALLGWLATTFPKARVIHCRRDVRDIALSCWMTNFVNIAWASDLEHIAHRIQQYQRIMSHWQTVLPAPMYEVEYERLVANQERESRRLVEWLGLRWDKACLDFHKNQRLVKTASVTQVRQPIYSRSVGRWKNYEQALKPFFRAMGMSK